MFGLNKQAHGNPRNSHNVASQSDDGLKGMLDALNRVQAVIRFQPDGTIIDANANFLKTVGYSLDEIKGKQHRIFVDPDYARSAAYAEFWNKLRGGNFEQAVYKRIAKDGSEVWLQASYNPVFDASGRLVEVVKFATDITQEKLRNAEFEGQINAVNKVMGTIEFDLNGTILTANSNFLALLGYTLAEVQGKHHRIFVDPQEVNSHEYQQFWNDLRSGHADTRVFKRLGKNGKIVWIQASYNPILDLNGRPFKVVKFATDLSDLITQTESTQSTAQNVATATQELSSSIAEISHNMQLTLRAAEEIKAATQGSGEEASRLNHSMQSMENMVQLIRTIAGRVNILALNAAIEAARAGEAGKGFAVVASEVKNLSDQVAKAVDEISSEIGGIQTISGSVVSSIQQTLSAATSVNDYVTSVSAAMEEQTAVTSEITRHSNELAEAVDRILAHSQKSA